MIEKISRQQLLSDLDISSGVGIEIGPLVSPVLSTSESNVKYVDRASTEDLREWFSNDPKIDVNDITEIDYVWGDQSLAEATGKSEYFDYCIASHVIEHIPDLITWLQEIASILKTGGVASFIIPDKRYSFDYLRQLTTTSDLVDNHVNRLRKPSPKHIFDHFSNITDLDISLAWSDNFDDSEIQPANPPQHAYQAVLDSVKNDKYVDSHCSVFSYPTFMDLINSIAELGLLDFKFKNIYPVRRNMLEFVAQLEKLDPKLDDDAKMLAIQSASTALRPQVLDIEFSSSSNCTPKIYYAYGESGFNEGQTVTLNYTAINQIKTLNFEFPYQDAPLQLRFDPSNTAGEFTIDSILLGRGNEKRNIALHQVKPINDIKSCKLTKGQLRIKSKRNATDPFLIIGSNKK